MHKTLSINFMDILLILKHNAMQCKVQNPCKTPEKNMHKFFQIIQYIVPYF